MQVSPDKNTRVEQANPIGRIPVSPQNAAGLDNGDFLVAAVERIQGDMLLLRLHGDSLLQAELQGGMRFAEGDVIEAAVSKDGGRCLLYVLNVLRTGSQPAPGRTDLIFPQTLSAMLSIIKRNPGLDADIALFLAENNIPDTPENIAALAQMSRGTGIGALLGQTLGLMAQTGETVQPCGFTAADTAFPGDSVPTQGGSLGDGAPESGRVQAAMPGQDPAAEPVQGLSGEAQTPSSGQAQDQGPASGMRADTEGGQTPAVTMGAQPGESPGAQSPSGEIEGQTAPRQGPMPGAPPAPPNTGGMNGQHDIGLQTPGQAGASQGSLGQEDMAARTGGDPASGAMKKNAGIGKRAQRLFFLPGEQGGAEVKKAAEGLSRELEALKSELVQSDIKYKELCLKNADQAIRQMELMDRAARFEHMQLPLVTRKGDCRTVELYVFRRKGGQKSAGEAGLSILVALDTEHIGRVETLIREASGSISLEFRLEQAEMVDIFKGNSVPLQEAVEAAGYRLTGMRFAGLDKRTTVLNAGELMELFAGEAAPGIDVQI